MENYIQQILENNNRVIVPEFGAFIVKQRSPLTIIFNEFLQYNDGMLVDFISKAEGISRDDAKKKIDDFVTEVSKSIAKDIAYDFGKIGIIKKNAAGKISIEEGSTSVKPGKKAAVSEAKKTEPAPATPSKSTKPAEPVKSEEEKKPAPEVKKEEKIPTVTPTEKPEEQKSAVKGEMKPITEPKSEEKKAVISEKKPDDKPVNENIPAKAEKKPEPEVAKVETEPYQSPPKRKRNVALWIIIIILVNGGLLLGYFLVKGDLGSLFNSNHSAESVDYFENEVLLPEAPEDDASMTEETAEPMVNSQEEIIESQPIAEPLTQKAISGTRYYVVAGVFRNEDNADNLLRELRDEGFNAEKFGRIGNLHAVSYDVFQSKADADKALIRIQKEKNPEAWIRIVQ